MQQGTAAMMASGEPECRCWIEQRWLVGNVVLAARLDGKLLASPRWRVDANGGVTRKLF